MAKSSASRIAETTTPGVIKGDREFLGIELTPAEGGIISETRHRVKRKGHDFHDTETKRAVHATLKSVMGHIKEHMGKHFKGGDED